MVLDIILSALSTTSILSGLFPSLLLLSSQIFVTLTSVSNGMCLFVMLYPSRVAVYSFTLSSVIVYLISFPSLYFGKSLNEYDQFPSSPIVTFADFIFVASASKLIVISSGLNPSWLLASFHVFVPATVVVSGLWVFVIVVIVPSLVFSVNS